MSLKSPAALLGVFVVGALVSIMASVFVVSAGLGSIPALQVINQPVLISLLFCAALLALSRQLLRHEGASARVLGLMPTSVRRREFAIGFAISSILFLLIAVVQSAAVGASWELQGLSGALAALIGLFMTAVLVLTEELLFRGVALRYLRALYGDWGAILLSAILFGVYHLAQSGDWGMGAVFRFMMPTVGGILFGWAAMRSQGLALPLGLHLGANWVQSSLAGFVTSGIASDAPVQTLWRIPITVDDVRALTAPDLISHVPYLVAIALATAVTWRVLIDSNTQHRTA